MANDAGVHNIQSSADWDKALKEDTTGTPMLVDCMATWCGPCKVIAPKIAELSQKHEGKLRVYKLDVDEVPEVAQDLQIRAMPTVLLYNGREVVKQIVGSDARAIEKMVNEWFGVDGDA